MNQTTNKGKEINSPWKISSYFRMESTELIIISITGILYNIGMIAGPWFEGQLAQKLFDILSGKQTLRDMVMLSAFYVAVILCVQLFRFFKRLYVRKFANHINRSMKRVIYQNLLLRSRMQLEEEGSGSLMTKAISDVDTCVEGMRKFTTEVFDTGVVMVSYMAMLLYYDYRLALISFLFPPVAYIIAQRLGRVVSAAAGAYKESAGRLNAATLDRVSNGITYRVYGQEENQNQLYEEKLSDYEKKAILANIWENSMQPLYQIIAMVSMIFILWLGALNVMHIGFKAWNIAAFTTFISCYTKLAVKSSKAAKLFNAVQKANVSWKRIKPFMEQYKDRNEKVDEVSQSESKIQIRNNLIKSGSIKKEATRNELTHRNMEWNGHNQKALRVENLGVKYDTYLFHNLSFKANPGEIIGITGPVASGKSSLGKALLGEISCEGKIYFGDKEGERGGEIFDFAGYMGHDLQLLSDTIENNILLGTKGDITTELRCVCMDEEVREMEDNIYTKIGGEGVRLSGGQQARIALARTLYHARPVMILDDPFSAVDKKTEKKIFENLETYVKQNGYIVFIITHRLSFFSKLSKVIWMENGKAVVKDHETLLLNEMGYATLYELQKAGDRDEK